MLTDIAPRALKPEHAAYKKSEAKGLFVTIYPFGKKVWGLATRVEGKQKFLTGGAYPEVTVKLARAWRDTVKAQLTLGMAPTATPEIWNRTYQAKWQRQPANHSRQSPANGSIPER